MPNSQESPSYWSKEISPEIFQTYTAVPSHVEVAIIGAGIMGVSTAYWLARSGIQVVLLEAQRPAWGASGRNAGLMLAGSRPLEDRSLVQSVLKDENIDADYSENGHLALASSEEVWAKICQESARRQHESMPVYALDHSACEDLLEMRVNTRFFGGRWFPQGGLINPVRFVHGLAVAAFRHGASLVAPARVLRVKTVAGSDCFNLLTTRGRLRARQVVFACSTQLSVFVPGFKNVITPVRGQVMATQPLPRLFTLGMAVDWGTVYWRQDPDGVIVIGGYRNYDPGAETTDQACLNPLIQDALSQFLPEAFPDFVPIRVNQRWAGIMDYPVDGRPVIGPMPKVHNQWIIACFGGHGLPVGLGAGKALAEAIRTGLMPAVLEPFDPGRFADEVPI